jgi:hypothetical protein
VCPPAAASERIRLAEERCSIYNRSRSPEWIHGRSKDCGQDSAKSFWYVATARATSSDDSGFQHRILTLDKSLRKDLEKEIPGNLEAVLRTERFQMLIDAAKEDKVDEILQAHHSDDQYETLLQRLAWGSTLAGLGGIAPSNGRFRRPLLGFSKVYT